MADDEDEDDGGEEGGHGVVSPVGVARLQCGVEGPGPGDGSVDEPVEDGEYYHGQESHH